MLNCFKALQASFDCTERSIFKAEATDLKWTHLHCDFIRQLLWGHVCTCCSIGSQKDYLLTMYPLPARKMCEEDVCRVFQRGKIGKAPGPGSLSPSCLRIYANQLTPTFLHIFKQSLELCEVPKKIHHRIKWLQPHCLDVYGHEIFWESSVKPSEGHCRPPAGPPAVCLQSKQVSGWFSQRHTTLHCASPRLPRDLCQDAVVVHCLDFDTLDEASHPALSITSTTAIYCGHFRVYGIHNFFGSK